MVEPSGARLQRPTGVDAAAVLPRDLRSPWPRLRLLAIVAAIWTAAAGNPIELLELRWLDQLQRWRLAAERVPAVSRFIVHVDIDLAALEPLTDTALEYQAFAQLITQAAQLGVRVVALDAILARGTPAVAQPVLDAVKAAEASGCTVVWAEALVDDPSGGLKLMRSRNLPPQARAGRIELHPDNDGILRRYRLVHDATQVPQPSLALAAYLAWLDIDWNKVKLEGADRVAWIEPSGKRRRLPNELLLEFRGGGRATGRGAFNHYTPPMLTEEFRKQTNNAPPLLENCIAIIAHTSPGVADIGATPLGPLEPRAHLHSTTLNGLIQDVWIRRVPRFVDAALVAAAALILGLMPGHLRSAAVLVACWVAGIAIVLGASILLVWQAQLMIGAIWISAVLGGATLIELARRYGMELIERERFTSAVARYFPPEVLKRVVANPELLAAQEVEITVLLSDLRNSTPLAEKLGAHGMLGLLNEVLTAQIEEVLKEQATLEHFVGDQFLAYWGAPEPRRDSADAAYRAATTLIGAVLEVGARQRSDVKALFGFGVALHSGRCVIGNRGSDQRLEYGIVGDLINAAARVESLTKLYGVRLLATREVLDRMAHPPLSRLVDHVRVVGKKEAIEMFELENPENTHGFGRVADEYGQAFGHYAKGDFSRALMLFESLALSGDCPSRVLAERCRRFSQQPPAEWTGIYSMETK